MAVIEFVDRDIQAKKVDIKKKATKKELEKPVNPDPKENKKKVPA